jgi:pimeloyl-ACP methyl ester carboxylesterase
MRQPAGAVGLRGHRSRNDHGGIRLASGHGCRPGHHRGDGGRPGLSLDGDGGGLRALFAPLLRNRNLLLIDARGTGRSTPVICPALQTFSANTATNAYRAVAAACGNQLNHTFRRADGSYVHASDLFDTANTARDVAAILRVLRLGKVDLYGDSYGTYFAQTFASRYPQMLRSVTLDAAYEVVGLDPWYTTTVTTARAAFDWVCRHSAACAVAAPGASWARIPALAERLRRSPIHGWTVGVQGQRVYQTVDVRGLVDMVNDAGHDYGSTATSTPPPAPCCDSWHRTSGTTTPTTWPTRGTTPTASTWPSHAPTTCSCSTWRRRRKCVAASSPPQSGRCRPARSHRSPQLSGCR